jgi:hypothetical protein
MCITYEVKMASFLTLWPYPLKRFPGGGGGGGGDGWWWRVGGGGEWVVVASGWWWRVGGGWC